MQCRRVNFERDCRINGGRGIMNSKCNSQTTPSMERNISTFFVYLYMYIYIYIIDTIYLVIITEEE